MADPPDIVWDDSNSSSLRANVFKVTGVQGEVALLFGESRPSQDHQRSLRLTRRVLINPSLAKQLVVALKKAVVKYESRYGSLEREAESPATQTPLPLPDFQSEESIRRAEALYGFVSSRKLTVALERSIKLSPGKLSPNRLLIGFKPDSLGQNPRETVAAIGARLDMPGQFRGSFDCNLAESTGIGFGIEEDGTKCILKAYLEFKSRYKDAITKSPASPDPYISHLGFKWDSEDNTKNALADYLCFPRLTIRQMLDRLSETLYPDKGDKVFKIVEGLLDRVPQKAGPDSLMYIEVTEKNNPRSSFDINLYSAQIRLEEICPDILNICRHFSISGEEFLRIYDPLKTRTFGHLSGGRDRKGNSFITVYIGE